MTKNQETPEEEILEETALEEAKEVLEEKADLAKEAEEASEQEEEAVSELDKVKEELESLNDRYLRTLAEYDNYRKRSVKEKDAIYPEARAAAFSSILPALDNFKRALEQGCSDESFLKGMQMTYDSLIGILNKEGVIEFGSVGDTFDPSMHNAVMHVDDEEKGDQEIVEVFQKGYKLGDKVLRYAMVKVAN